jgi:hypothetical protein
MAHGDIGGAVTELVITCSTPKEGRVDIKKGDAVCLTGNYEVINCIDRHPTIFGQALASTEENRKAIPVKVRGVCIFTYYGSAPLVDGRLGVWMGGTCGQVEGGHPGKGINLKVDEEKKEVHVLL